MGKKKGPNFSRPYFARMLKGWEKMMHERIIYYRGKKEITYIHCENFHKSYPVHTHAEHVVVGFIQEGSVCVICGGQKRIYDAGEWFYIGQDIPHALEPAEDKAYSIITMCIPVPVILSEKGQENTDAMRLKQLIANTPQLPLSIKDMAGSIALSPYHMIRKFKNACGLTPHQFQIQCRVRKAQKLLEEGRSVVEAAYAAGFCDQSHFDRCFHKIVRLTPGEYKKVVKSFPMPG